MHVITSPCGGGAELLVRELVSRINDREIEASAVYFNTQLPCAKLTRLTPREISLNIGNRNLKAIFLLRDLIKRRLATDKNLIIHVHLTWPFFFVPLAVIGLPVKIVFTEHNTINRRRNIPLMWILERLFYSQYERIICISEGVKKSLSSWVGPAISRRLVTIPNGSRIYSLIERPTLEGRLPRLISVGSLSYRKNFVTAINAIALLREEVESYTIIGEGDERPALEKLIQEKNLENKVKLLGWSDDIEAQLHEADIQLIPSLWEGFGLVAVEGMSTGLPIAASDVTGLREVLGGESNPSVVLVEKMLSPLDWVSAIRNLISKNQSLGFENIANFSREQAEKFSFDKMARGYFDIYHEVQGEECIKPRLRDFFNSKNTNL